MYNLSISLRGCPHPCTRELVVDDSLTLNELSWAINLAFGWNCSHLNEFEIEGKAVYSNFSDGEDDRDLPLYNTEHFTLKEAFAGIDQLTYLYDLGDHWMHDIAVRPVKSTRGTKVRLKKGEGICPPDDCGGIFGYQQLLETLKKRGSEEAREWRIWLDGRPVHPSPWRKSSVETPLARLNYFLGAGLPITEASTPIFAVWLEQDTYGYSDY